MLVSIKIFSFRTCKNIFLRGLKDPLVLLGHNGAGKTNILKAIAWLASNASQTLDELSSMPETGHVEAIVRLKTGRYRYSVDRHYVSEDDNTARLVIEENLVKLSPRGATEQMIFSRKGESLVLTGGHELTLSEHSLTFPLVHAFAKIDKTLSAQTTELIHFFSGITYYPILANRVEGSSLIHQGSDYDDWKKKPRRSLDKDPDLSLALIDVWLTNRAKFEEILTLLGSRGLGVLDDMSVVDITTGEKNKTRRLLAIFFQPSNSDRSALPTPLEELSMGTRRVVQLITHLVIDRITVALIEQPEDAIHPALLRKLMGIISTHAHDFQFVIASHSPDVFNCMRPQQVRMVTRDSGVTSVKALTPNEIELARAYLEETGTLSEFLESM